MATILLPIETLNREFDYKLMLGCLLANNNEHQIYIGEFHFIDRLMPFFDKGIYAGKTVLTRMAEFDTGKNLRLYKKKNFKILYLNEEGLGFVGSEDTWGRIFERQYDLEVFGKEDVLCEWCDFQKNFDTKRRGESQVGIQVTGHPKFDLYKPKFRFFYQDKIAEIRKKYPSYTLISGRYSIANHGLGLSHVFSSSANYKVKEPEKRLRHIGWYVDAALYLNHMILLVHHLAAKFPEQLFIYRPHPSENFEFYHYVFKGVSNVIVAHEGSVGPWIFAADAVIHDGCTTGIEAFLAQVPLINYKPFNSAEFDIYLQNQMGFKCTTREDVFDALNKVYNKSQIEYSIEDKAFSLLYNLKEDSYQKFVDVVKEKIASADFADAKVPSKSDILRLSLERKSKIGIVKILNKLPGREIKRKKLKMALQKFPGINKAELEKKVKVIENGLGKKISCEYLNDVLIKLS